MVVNTGKTGDIIKDVSLTTRRMKELLTLVSIHPQGFSDLMEAAKGFGGGASMKDNKQVARLLKDLQYLGLIYKNEEGMYVLRRNVQTYDTYSQYRFLIDHSEKLMEGKKNLQIMIDEGNVDREEKVRKPQVKGRKRLLTEEEHTVRLFIEHLKTGYPETYDSYVNLNNSFKEVQCIEGKVFSDVKKILPMLKSDPVTHYERPPSTSIHRPGTNPRTFAKNPDPMFALSQIIMAELKSVLQYKPSLEDVPYEWDVDQLRDMPRIPDYSNVTLKIGLSKFTLSRGSVEEVVEALPHLRVVFDDIRKWNECEESIEGFRSEIIGALIRIEALVRSGKPLKGVCTSCRDVVIKE